MNRRLIKSICKTIRVSLVLLGFVILLLPSSCRPLIDPVPLQTLSNYHFAELGSICQFGWASWSLYFNGGLCAIIVLIVVIVQQ